MAKTSWTQVVFKRKNGFKGYNSQQFPTVHFKMHQTILSFTSAPINVQFPPEILGIIRLAHWKILQNFIKPGFSLFQLSTRSDVWSNGQKVWCEKPQIYRNGLHHGIIFVWFVFALHFTPWLHTANILPWMVLFFACISISQCLTGSAIVLYLKMYLYHTISCTVLVSSAMLDCVQWKLIQRAIKGKATWAT